MTIPLVAQRFGHRGVALLRIAVLDVLYQARKDNECLGCAGISRRAGIFREPGYARKRGNDDIVMGVLGSLVKSELLNKCTQKNGNPGWQLTDATFTRRDEEITTVSDWGGNNWIISAYRTRQWGFCPACPSVLPKRPDVDHIKGQGDGRFGRCRKQAGSSPDHVGKVANPGRNRDRFDLSSEGPYRIGHCH